MRLVIVITFFKYDKTKTSPVCVSPGKPIADGVPIVIKAPRGTSTESDV